MPDVCHFATSIKLIPMHYLCLISFVKMAAFTTIFHLNTLYFFIPLALIFIVAQGDLKIENQHFPCCHHAAWFSNSVAVKGRGRGMNSSTSEIHQPTLLALFQYRVCLADPTIKGPQGLLSFYLQSQNVVESFLNSGRSRRNMSHNIQSGPYEMPPFK